MFRDTDFFWTMRWMRADALAIFIASLGAMTLTDGSWWWFFSLFLVPDLSMMGYLFGSRTGAVAYNTAHMYAWPLGLLTIGLASHASFWTTAAFSWIAHIALDHVVGYGLKLPTGFERTVLGPIGRSRRERAVAVSALASGTESSRLKEP
jgi:hypothetical protein